MDGESQSNSYISSKQMFSVSAILYCEFWYVGFNLLALSNYY